MEIINSRHNSLLKKYFQSELKNVIIILSVLVLMNVRVVNCDKDYTALSYDEGESTAHILEQCMQKCPEQVSEKSFLLCMGNVHK